MQKENGSAEYVSSGVEDLIARIREDEVEQGKAKADEIIQAAEEKAEQIVRDAEKEANKLVKKAHQEIEEKRRAGNDALQVAGRDTLLALKTELMQTFRGEIRRLVGTETRKPELLRSLILEIAGSAKQECNDSKEIEILLPSRVIGLEELTKNPEELEKGLITHFVKMISDDMLKEGVKFGVSEDNKGGLRLYLKDKEVVIDLSDHAISDILLQHLQPRFRALLEGIVRR